MRRPCPRPRVLSKVPEKALYLKLLQRFGFWNSGLMYHRLLRGCGPAKRYPEIYGLRRVKFSAIRAGD